MVYRMQLEQLSDGAATVLITNDLMNRMGVTKEQLHADAMANSEVVKPASMRTMAEVMAQMMGMSVEDFPMDMSGPQMYVVTTAWAVFDKSTFFDKEESDMSARLEKIAAEREKARRKRDEWDARMKEWDQKYREQENSEIHEMVHAARLTPEQLAEVLKSLQSGTPDMSQYMNEEENNDEI